MEILLNIGFQIISARVKDCLLWQLDALPRSNMLPPSIFYQSNKETQSHLISTRAAKCSSIKGV